MKKSILILISFLGMFFASSSALYAEGMYLGGDLGVAFLSDSDVDAFGYSAEISSDTGYSIGLALGYEFEYNIRLEAAIGYQANDLDELSVYGYTESLDGDISILSFMANGYYDFKNSTAFTPFLMAGIGLANINADLDSIDESDDDTVFAYQAGLGVGYALNDRVTLDLKYVYFATEDVDFDGIDAEISSHNAVLGIRFAF